MKKRKTEWHDKFFSGIYTQMLAGTFDRATNEHQARGIKRRLKLRKGQSVLDVPCGQGRVTIPLARLGMKAYGLDRQAHYIRLAKAAAKRQRAKVEFTVGDMRALPFREKFNGLFNWFGSFGYFSDKENRKVLEGFYRALKPGGQLLVEGLNKDFILMNFKERMEVTAGGVKSIHENRWSKADRRMHSRWTLLSGRKKEVHQIVMRLFNARELKLLFRQAGFRQVRFYDGLNGRPAKADTVRLIVVAQKPR
jgi:ubiquinone/menaquinone biosynthesis C-methylase UbiE